jgi:hypothetical protein
MPRDMRQHPTFQVFLNYPFDDEFAPLAHAMSFAVVAAGFLPVCAYDVTAPDISRLEILVDATAITPFTTCRVQKGQGPIIFHA